MSAPVSRISRAPRPRSARYRAQAIPRSWHALRDGASIQRRAVVESHQARRNQLRLRAEIRDVIFRGEESAARRDHAQRHSSRRWYRSHVEKCAGNSPGRRALRRPAASPCRPRPLSAGCCAAGNRDLVRAFAPITVAKLFAHAIRQIEICCRRQRSGRFFHSIARLRRGACRRSGKRRLRGDSDTRRLQNPRSLSGNPYVRAPKFSAAVAVEVASARSANANRESSKESRSRPAPTSMSACSICHVFACGTNAALSPICSAGLMSLRGLLPTIQPCVFTILNCSTMRSYTAASFSSTISIASKYGCKPERSTFAACSAGSPLVRVSSGDAWRDRPASRERRPECAGESLPVPRRAADFLHDLAARGVARPASCTFLPANGESCARRSRAGGCCGARFR